MSGIKDDLFGDTPYAPPSKEKTRYSLYDGNPPSQKHSETSRAAASQIKKQIGPLHLEILNFLTTNPQGATDEEMQSRIPMSANTQRPRRVELTQMGRVVDSGRRKPTRSRREAVVWALKREPI